MNPTQEAPSPNPPYPANRIRTLPAGERPQERLERFGAAALSDTELLAMIVRSGTRGQDVLTLSSKVISEAGSLAGLLAWHEADFRAVRGIGRVKALQLVAAMEVARRAISLQPNESPVLNRADLIAAHLETVASGLDVEKFWVLCLNRRNRLRKRVEVSSGTATAALAHPREVFRSAIRESAAAVVCAHNHPSGDPSPSAADIQLTRQLREAAAAVDIPLLDHVIIGRRGADPLGRGYYSFREAGLLCCPAPNRRTLTQQTNDIHKRYSARYTHSSSHKERGRNSRKTFEASGDEEGDLCSPVDPPGGNCDRCRRACLE